MTNRQYVLVFLVFGVFASVPFACAPQVVDAVDPEAETGGTGVTGGAGGAARATPAEARRVA